MKNNELLRETEKMLQEKVKHELLRFGLISNNPKAHTVAISNLAEVALKYGNSLKSELVKGLEELKGGGLSAADFDFGFEQAIDEAIELVKKT